MKVKDLVLCAIFAGFSAVLSQITIPIGLVPINLTHISVFMASGLLGAKRASMSQIIFVLLGAIGIPVFSGMRGGLETLAGPTGGFIIGYIACAFVSGYVIEKLGRKMNVLIAAMFSGMLATYILGILWFMYVTNSSFIYSFAVCILPFLLGDAMKIILSSFLVKKLGKIVL